MARSTPSPSPQSPTDAVASSQAAPQTRTRSRSSVEPVTIATTDSSSKATDPTLAPATPEAPETPIVSTSASSSSTNGHTATAPSALLKPTEPYTRHNAPKRSNVKPRWHTQPYMMFLALRSMPNHTAARQEVINAAVALDRKFSAEKGLPRVFTGKTPMNSASACLTNNGDKYFIPFKPEGSKSTHFRLAYAPGDFDTAVKEYDGWMEKLIKHDWPLCFGVPKEGAIPIHILEQQEQARRALDQQKKEEATGASGDSWTPPTTGTLYHDLASSSSIPGDDTSVIIPGMSTGASGDSWTPPTTGTLCHDLASSSSIPGNDTSVIIPGMLTAAQEQSVPLSNDDHPPDSKKRSPEFMEDGLEEDTRNVKKIKAELDSVDICTVDMEEPIHVQIQGQQETINGKDVDGDHESKVADKMKQLELKSTPAALTSHEPASASSAVSSTTAAAAAALGAVLADKPSTPPAMTSAPTLARTMLPDSQRIDEYHLEDLDLSGVPTCLADVVRVDVSSIPDSGNGLFAKIDIPASTPLGFYFGVPMTEYEFDSLKDGVGLASHYSIMYRRTVLDATDENGMPYSDPKGRLYCPFHFMNELPSGNITFITGSVVNQVICQTNKDIKAGEELFVFYGKEVDRFWEKEGDAAGKDPSKGSPSSRASSPARREESQTDRPRRSNVHKPARYTR